MTLTPDYLTMDFTTIVSKFKEELAVDDVFRDYNYEGSNISVLIELLSYIGDLNTFYLNKLAQNINLETADLYETVNAISRQNGYHSKGYRTARSTLTVTISAASGSTIPINNNDILYIPAWHNIDSSSYNDDDTIKYSTVLSQTETVSSVTASGYTFTVPVYQGDIIELDGFKGSDIVNNELIIPSWNYAYDNDIDDEYPTIQLTINDETWQRVSDFYNQISALQDENNVYMFYYDKYERSKIVFNSARNVPESSDIIEITLLKTLGEDGEVAANTITTPDINFIKNITQDSWINNDYVTVTNLSVSTGAAKPETIEEIKENTSSLQHSQYRNVTKEDYISHLESRSDITNAACWGEQDVAPSGNVAEYNKVYLSVIPSDWTSDTINTTNATWLISNTLSGNTYIPESLSQTWESTLSNYLENRKMLTAYEIFELPDIVFFHMELGVRRKRMYSFTDISNDIKNKLIHWFRQANREFNEVIKFNDIVEYLLDTTEVSPTDNFTYLKGVRNINIRDIKLNNTIYEPNLLGNYPQYTLESYNSDYENILRPIKLGLNQFPVLMDSIISVVEET